MNTDAYIASYLGNVKSIADMLLLDHATIVAIINRLFDAWEDRRPVFILGNGGSASTASHFAADLAKTINDVPRNRGIRALTPWDNIPSVSAIVNDRSKADCFTAWLDTF